MSFPTDLTHFKASEFKYPDRMNVPFLRWLDRVRDLAGVPLTLTDDARVDADPEPSGSAGSRSLHHRGCAVDLRSRTLSASQKWQVLNAIVTLAMDTPSGWKVEFESVYNEDGDKHWHLGLDWNAGKTHEFIEKDD